MPGGSRKLLVLLILSFILNLFFLYRIFDTAISLDYARQRVAALKAEADESLKLLQDVGENYPRAALDDIAIRHENAGVLVKRADDKIQIGRYVFVLENGVVSSIKDFSEF